MEPLEAAAAGDPFVDDLLLDFSSEDIPNSPAHYHHQNPQPRHHSTANKPPPSSEEENPCPSLLDDEVFQEELEWLSNKDAFPTLETFDIPSNPKRPSPVSVLESVGLLSGGGGCPSRRVPVKARSKGTRRRRRVLSVLGFEAPAEQEKQRRGDGGERRRCLHCETEETPQWRAGPEGPKTLCNACGVRYKSGRLVPEYRPANSPSFSCELHSNSHRKIVEMRRTKDGDAAAAGKKNRSKRPYIRQ